MCVYVWVCVCIYWYVCMCMCIYVYVCVCVLVYEQVWCGNICMAMVVPKLRTSFPMRTMTKNVMSSYAYTQHATRVYCRAGGSSLGLVRRGGGTLQQGGRGKRCKLPHLGLYPKKNYGMSCHDLAWHESKSCHWLAILFQVVMPWLSIALHDIQWLPMIWHSIETSLDLIRPE